MSVHLTLRSPDQKDQKDSSNEDASPNPENRMDVEPAPESQSAQPVLQPVEQLSAEEIRRRRLEKLTGSSQPVQVPQRTQPIPTQPATQPIPTQPRSIPLAIPTSSQSVTKSASPSNFATSPSNSNQIPPLSVWKSQMLKQILRVDFSPNVTLSKSITFIQLPSVVNEIDEEGLGTKKRKLTKKFTFVVEQHNLILDRILMGICSLPEAPGIPNIPTASGTILHYFVHCHRVVTEEKTKLLEKYKVQIFLEFFRIFTGFFVGRNPRHFRTQNLFG